MKPKPDRTQLRIDLPDLPAKLTADFLVKSLRMAWKRASAKGKPAPTAFAFLVQTSAMDEETWIATSQIGNLLGLARAMESMLARIDSEPKEHQDPRLLGARMLLRAYLTDPPGKHR